MHLSERGSPVDECATHHSLMWLCLLGHVTKRGSLVVMSVTHRSLRGFACSGMLLWHGCEHSMPLGYTQSPCVAPLSHARLAMGVGACSCSHHKSKGNGCGDLCARMCMGRLPALLWQRLLPQRVHSSLTHCAVAIVDGCVFVFSLVVKSWAASFSEEMDAYDKKHSN